MRPLQRGVFLCKIRYGLGKIPEKGLYKIQSTDISAGDSRCRGSAKV